MLPDFDIEYRKDVIKCYSRMMDHGEVEITVPIQDIVRLLSETISYRARLDYLMDVILRHNFTIPQRVMVTNDLTIDLPDLKKEK
jgi:ACT domain-containing protein